MFFFLLAQDPTESAVIYNERHLQSVRSPLRETMIEKLRGMAGGKDLYVKQWNEIIDREFKSHNNFIFDHTQILTSSVTARTKNIQHLQILQHLDSLSNLAMKHVSQVSSLKELELFIDDNEEQNVNITYQSLEETAFKTLSMVQIVLDSGDDFLKSYSEQISTTISEYVLMDGYKDDHTNDIRDTLTSLTHKYKTHWNNIVSTPTNAQQGHRLELANILQEMRNDHLIVLQKLKHQMAEESKPSIIKFLESVGRGYDESISLLVNQLQTCATLFVNFIKETETIIGYAFQEFCNMAYQIFEILRSAIEAKQDQTREHENNYQDVIDDWSLLFYDIGDAFFMISNMIMHGLRFVMAHYHPVNLTKLNSNVQILIDDWVLFFTDVCGCFVTVNRSILDVSNSIVKKWKSFFTSAKNFVVMVNDTILKGLNHVLKQYNDIRRTMDKNLKVVITDWKLFYNDIRHLFAIITGPLFDCLELILNRYYELRQVIAGYWFCFLTGIANCFVTWTVSDVLVILYGANIFLYFYHFYTNHYFIECPCFK